MSDDRTCRQRTKERDKPGGVETETYRCCTNLRRIDLGQPGRAPTVLAEAEKGIYRGHDQDQNKVVGPEKEDGRQDPRQDKKGNRYRLPSPRVRAKSEGDVSRDGSKVVSQSREACPLRAG